MEVRGPEVLLMFLKITFLQLTAIQTGFFSPFLAGGGGVLQLCSFKTAYAMATKFAQDSARSNSNHYRCCDKAMSL